MGPTKSVASGVHATEHPESRQTHASSEVIVGATSSHPVIREESNALMEDASDGVLRVGLDVNVGIHLGMLSTIAALDVHLSLLDVGLLLRGEG